MKTKLIYGLMTLCAAAALTACNDDDEISASSVPEDVMSTFKDMYPGSYDIDWEKLGQYYIASFMYKTDDCDAWFDPDGSWLMTEYDYNESLISLPVLMQNAFQESAYATWFIDDVTLYEKPFDDTFCEIEVVTVGQPETSIFINIAGEIMNIVPNYNGTITPVTNITLL